MTLRLEALYQPSVRGVPFPGLTKLQLSQDFIGSLPLTHLFACAHHRTVANDISAELLKDVDGMEPKVSLLKGTQDCITSHCLGDRPPKMAPI